LFRKEVVKMSVKIIKASTKDSEIISKLHALSWKTAYKGIVPQEYLDELKYDFWVDAFQNWISNNILTVQLLYRNETPAGCIAYGKARDENYLGWVEIVSIYIHPDYWRRGYGHKLLETAILDMKKRGYQNCYLWVLRENHSAQKFYEKHGFYYNDEECIFEINNQPLTDIRYVLTL
jgi:ribosomal protein S18 acetylase RimI-like enzyme